MEIHHSLIKRILKRGTIVHNRTGVDRISVIGEKITHDMSQGFPALTTRNFAFKAMMGELLWILSGSSDVEKLREFSNLSEKDFCIWKKDLDNYNIRTNKVQTNQSLGYVYGSVLRNKNKDQLLNLISSIKKVIKDPTNPANSRLLQVMWDPNAHSPKMDPNICAVPPCHFAFQFFVRADTLNCVWYQRSADVVLGIPFNLASYSALTAILSYIVGLKPGSITGLLGDAHIYKNHLSGVKEMLNRTPLKLPNLVLNKQLDPLGLESAILYGKLTAKDFSLSEYKHYAKISFDMASS